MEKKFIVTKSQLLRVIKAGELSTNFSGITSGKLLPEHFNKFFKQVENDLPSGFVKTGETLEKSGGIGQGIQLKKQYKLGNTIINIRLVCDIYNGIISVVVYVMINNDGNRNAFEFGTEQKVTGLNPNKLIDSLIAKYNMELKESNIQL